MHQPSATAFESQPRTWYAPLFKRRMAVQLLSSTHLAMARAYVLKSVKEVSG